MSAPLAIFLVTIAVTFFNLYRCSYPHLEGGHSSLVYFGEIAKKRESELINEYTSISATYLLNDVCGQIWRNSEIVPYKYRYLKTATRFAMVSLLPCGRADCRCSLKRSPSAYHRKLPGGQRIRPTRFNFTAVE